MWTSLASVIDEQMNISQVVVSDIFDGMKQKRVFESEKILITRSLLLDFSEKSESSECSSVLTYQAGESECKDKSSPSPDDDDASIWSKKKKDCEDYSEDEED